MLHPSPSALPVLRPQDVVKLPIQVNGKVRATLDVQRNIDQEAAVQVRIEAPQNRPFGRARHHMSAWSLTSMEECH